MATSPARIAANRRHALKSTGPRTLEGKQRSSRNARVHGLFAPDFRTPVYTRLFLDFTREYRPATATERTLVFWLSAAASRVIALDRIEHGVWLLFDGDYDRLVPSIVTFSRRGNAADLLFYRVLRKLELLQSTRYAARWVRSCQNQIGVGQTIRVRRLLGVGQTIGVRRLPFRVRRPESAPRLRSPGRAREAVPRAAP